MGGAFLCSIVNVNLLELSIVSLQPVLNGTEIGQSLISLGREKNCGKNSTKDLKV